MNTIRFAFVAVLALFVGSITSTVKAQTFSTDGYVVVSYNTRTATGQGAWTVGWSASNGTVHASVIGGSGTAVVDVTFGTNLTKNGQGWRTTASVVLYPGLSGNVGSTLTGLAHSSIQSDDVGVGLGMDTSQSNPFSWAPTTTPRDIAPKQLTFTAHGNTSDTNTNTVNDDAGSTGYFSVN